MKAKQQLAHGDTAMKKLSSFWNVELSYENLVGVHFSLKFESPTRQTSFFVSLREGYWAGFVTPVFSLEYSVGDNVGAYHFALKQT